jgi:hypothetical protein
MLGWLLQGVVLASTVVARTARSRGNGVGALLLLAALPLLAGSQPEHACEPGGPEVIVTGTILSIEQPRPVCEAAEGAVGAETCLASTFVQCAKRAAVRIEPPVGSGYEVLLAPLDPPIENAGSLRVCDLTPGSYQVTLCPADPDPLICSIELRAGVIGGPVIRWQPATTEVRLHIDAIEAGELGEPAGTHELTFRAAAGRTHEVGQHTRVELQRARTLTDQGVQVGGLVEYRCYIGAGPLRRRSTGCGGCTTHTPAGVAPLLLALIGLSARRARRARRTR